MGDVPRAVPVVSKHPKVTVYVPKRILQGLDNWKKCYGVDSRSEAIVTILEDYLEAVFLKQYEEPQKSAAPPRIRLSAVLDEIYELKERVDALEESISTASQEVPSTVLFDGSGSISTILCEAPNTAPMEIAEPGEVQESAPSTSPAEPPSQPPAPLTQSALAKRLGCSDKAVEKQRKHGKESFAQWSGDHDPDGIAWTWEGSGGRGQPLRFVPLIAI